jgi:GT2 family glycosyltransferase
MGVSIIIVNYNVANEVRFCLKSIYKYFDKIDYEVIVVDNNSSDRTIETVGKEFPNVRFELLTENLGYSKANNYASQISKYDFLLFLNPDTVVIEDFLSPIIEFVNSNKNVGACGPMLLYKDMSFQNSTGRKLGYIYEAAEALMLINYYRKILNLLNRHKFKIQNSFQVYWMSGACLFIKKDVFIKAKGFNAEYFLNYEDIDLCNKINLMGYKNYYFPYLKCIHLDQTSQKRDFERFTLSRYESRLIYSRNNYSDFKAFLIRIIHILGLFLRLIFVKFVYKEDEKLQRFRGYKKSLKLYLS